MKIELSKGEALFIDFVTETHRVSKVLGVVWDDKGIRVRLGQLDETGQIVAYDTLMELDPGEPEDEPNSMKGFAEALCEIFGDQVMVVDEHGIRPLKKEKQT